MFFFCSEDMSSYPIEVNKSLEWHTFNRMFNFHLTEIRVFQQHYIMACLLALSYEFNPSASPGTNSPFQALKMKGVT